MSNIEIVNVAFTSDSFPLLLSSDFPSIGYHYVGIDRLTYDDGRGTFIDEGSELATFVSFLGSPDKGEFQWDKVMSVYYDGSIVDPRKIYTPVIMSEAGVILLVVGANTFEITVDENKCFLVGDLVGELKSELIKTAEKANEWEKFYVEFSPQNNEENVVYSYQIPLLVKNRDQLRSENSIPDSLAYLSLSYLALVMKKRKEVRAVLLEYIMPRGTGGAAIKMAELGVGEYQVRSFALKVSDNDYPDQFIITLEDGRKCWSNDSIATQLRKLGSIFLKNGKGLTLIITSIVKRGKGYSVTAAIQNRQANANTSSVSKPNKSLSPALDSDITLDVASTVMTEISTPVEVLDQIPF